MSSSFLLLLLFLGLLIIILRTFLGPLLLLSSAGCSSAGCSGCSSVGCCSSTDSASASGSSSASDTICLSFFNSYLMHFNDFLIFLRSSLSSSSSCFVFWFVVLQFIDFVTKAL
ncbi:hypothetical protein GPJ56_010950 [Histomonas meleagridis]|nr:hypothetical protein GPJ56_010950 [Histomonas meleagridis]